MPNHAKYAKLFQDWKSTNALSIQRMEKLSKGGLLEECINLLYILDATMEASKSHMELAIHLLSEAKESSVVLANLRSDILRRNAVLAVGRAKAVEKRKETAAEKQERLSRAIADLFDAPGKPGWGWSNSEIVSFLKRGFDYADSTILAKVKTEAAKYRKGRKEEQARIYLNR